MFNDSESGGDGSKIVFLHIPKTAGSSFTSMLLHAPQQYLLYPLSLAYPYQKPIAGEPKKALETYKIFAGHYYCDDVISCIPGKKKIITFIRDPKRRIFSHYYWLRYMSASSSEEQPFIFQLAREFDFLTFLRSGNPDVVVGATDNVITRHLTGPRHWNTRGCFTTDEEELFDIAMTRLRQFHFVGFQERMSADIDRFYAKMRRPRPPLIPEINSRKNVDAEKLIGPEVDITPEIDAELDRLTRIDRRIYEAAEREFGNAADSARARLVRGLMAMFGPGLQRLQRVAGQRRRR